MNQKVVIVPFEQGGYAKLMFTKIGNEWTCTMSDEMMNTLQACINGEEIKEYVTDYADLNGFDGNI